jgi:CheY-like chemotaxis protein
MPTILVVDDEEPLRRYVARVLEDAGYRVLLARNGLEGLTLIERQSPRVHLVVTDVQMPLMTGPELAACLAGGPVQPPVLYITGGDGRVSGPRLRKPFLPPELIEMVQLLLLRDPAPAGVLEGSSSASADPPC